MNKDIFKFTGIRKKLIIYFLVTTIILGFTSVFSYYNAKIVFTRLQSIIGDYVYLNDLNNDVNSLATEVEKYLTTKSSDALLNYYTYYNDLQDKSNDISRTALHDVDMLMIKDIGYMIDALLEESDKAVKAKRGRISSEYIAHFRRSTEISENIKYYINILLNNKLQKGSFRYTAITKNMSYLSYFNLFLIIASVIINISLAIIFTYRLTRPIVELSHSAERVSKGDYDIDPVKIESDDEIDILTKAFNKMIINIKNHIDEIRGQAEVEKKLKEQEMQNLKMRSLLKDAELKSLQSQINPHFLFNTLNAASQLSMMEGADKASKFIENAAELFRYNLRKLDKPVTLEEEVNNVSNYMYILKTRFGDRISYTTHIDKEVLNIRIPCAIIQPIVENAYIHGLEDLEGYGQISLNITRGKDKVFIKVIDNGIGMDEERVEEIMSDSNKDDLTRRHVTGIGMHNVIDRLRLFYNISDIGDVIDIKSKVGFGTKVVLKIPFLEDVNINDKAPNS